MLIRKSYKFKLKTNSEIEQAFSLFAGHSRFVWNYFWHINKRRLENKQKIMRYFEMNYWLTLLKASREYGFLAEAPAHILQQKLKDLDKAYRDGFDKKQPLKRMPCLKKKTLDNSFRYPEPKHFKIDNKRICLPKIGWACFFKSQNIKGQPKNLTVTKQDKNWFCSLQVELDIDIAKKPISTSLSSSNSNSVGIDVGISKFAALSNGEYIESINSFRLQEKKLAKAQRLLKRKKRFSNNWRKCVKKIQQVHSKIKNIRLDFLHKETTKISKNHALVVIEDLKIKNMSRSAKGTETSPGKNVKSKSGLNKSILDQGWGIFKSQLEYKMIWNGGLLIKVPPRHTSQKCSKCSYLDANNRVNQAVFACTKCAYQDNADRNAAKNILAAGHAVIACGEKALDFAVKQESLGMGNQIPA